MNSSRRDCSINSYIQRFACSWRKLASCPVLLSQALCSSTASQISAMPSRARAEQVITRGVQPVPETEKRCSALSYSQRAASAFARLLPSALLKAMRSVISTMPRFMPCNSSPASASISSRKKSTMERTAVSDWPTPTVSTNTLRYPAASQSSMVSRVRRAPPPPQPPAGGGRGAAGHAAQRSAGGRRPDEGAVVVGQRFHARLVAQDAAARYLAGGVHRQYGDFLRALAGEVHAQHFDEGTFAGARHAGDAHANGIAGVGQALLQYILGQLDVLGVQAFDQGDGSAENRAVAAQHAFDVRVAGEAPPGARWRRLHLVSLAKEGGLGVRRRPGACPTILGVTQEPHLCGLHRARRQRFQDLLGGQRNHGAGSKDAGHAALVEEVVILRRNHAADDHQDVLAAELPEFFDDLRHQRVVAGRQRRDT